MECWLKFTALAENNHAGRTEWHNE